MNARNLPRPNHRVNMPFGLYLYGRSLRLRYRHAHPPHSRKNCGGGDLHLNAIRPAPASAVYGGKSCGDLRRAVRDVAAARRVAKPLDVPSGVLRTGLVVRADTPA